MALKLSTIHISVCIQPVYLAMATVTLRRGVLIHAHTLAWNKAEVEEFVCLSHAGKPGRTYHIGVCKYRYQGNW